jgi:hypothetical protein
LNQADQPVFAIKAAQDGTGNDDNSKNTEPTMMKGMEKIIPSRKAIMAFVFTNFITGGSILLLTKSFILFFLPNIE